MPVPFCSRLTLLSIAVLTVISSPQRLRADAWTQPAGHGQFILKFGATSIEHQFDESGAVERFSNGGRFRKAELNPYFEYGLNARTTLVLNAFIPALQYSNNYGSNSSMGLGDVEGGVRVRLNSPESATAVSAQFSLQLPAYSAHRNPAPGNHQTDTEARLMAGRGFAVGRRYGFASIGAGYRYRNGAPADQFRSDASLGLNLTPRFMVIGQVFGITGLRNGLPLSALNNPNLHSDFDLYKTQISLVTRVSRSTRIQLGWSNAFAGRNTGNGQTWMVGVWKDF